MEMQEIVKFAELREKAKQAGLTEEQIERNLALWHKPINAMKDILIEVWEHQPQSVDNDWQTFEDDYAYDLFTEARELAYKELIKEGKLVEIEGE